LPPQRLPAVSNRIRQVAAVYCVKPLARSSVSQASRVGGSLSSDAEVLHFIDHHALFGRGMGYVDAHLLAAVRLTAGAELWTNGKKLRGVAEQLRLAFALPRRH
jgi:hypothetical protein